MNIATDTIHAPTRFTNNPHSICIDEATIEDRVEVIINCRVSGQSLDGYLLPFGKSRVVITRSAYEHALTLVETEDDKRDLAAAERAHATGLQRYIADQLGDYPEDGPEYKRICDRAKAQYSGSVSGQFLRLTDREIKPYLSIERVKDHSPAKSAQDLASEKSAAAVAQAVNNAIGGQTGNAEAIATAVAQAVTAALAAQPKGSK